jgi:hypothetical protein
MLKKLSTIILRQEDWRKRPQALILNILFILMIQIYNTIMKPPQLFSHRHLIRR